MRGGENPIEGDAFLAVGYNEQQMPPTFYKVMFGGREVKKEKALIE